MVHNIERFSQMSNEQLFEQLMNGRLSKLQAKAIACVMESRFPTPIAILEKAA
jgi:hypothetical protein